MASIRATCPHCRTPVPLEPAAVVLRADLPADAPGEAHAGGAVLGAYSFLCSTCGRIATRSADAGAVRLLLLAGVWADPDLIPDGDIDAPVPALLLHPELPPPGPALTSDDLLDLHRVMAAEDWFSRLAEVPRLTC